MTESPTHTDLACHLRRLLETVREACAVEGRWGWLAAPVALLTWLRERRMRREQALALAAFEGLVGQFLAMLEDFRAGKLGAPVTSDVEEAPTEDAEPLRGSASSAVKDSNRGERRETRRAPDSPDAGMSAEFPAARESWQP